MAKLELDLPRHRKASQASVELSVKRYNRASLWTPAVELGAKAVVLFLPHLGGYCHPVQPPTTQS